MLKMKTKLEKFGKFKVKNPNEIKGGIQRYSCSIFNITVIVHQPMSGENCSAIGNLFNPL